ncbi:MAG TPA: radical SAM protein [Patescibacteria group bacterium]|nr:radical SAM protein [Patescibacteria group bacterium]
MSATLLYADSRGEIYDAPGWQALGRSGTEMAPLQAVDLIPLPEGAELMLLPGRDPVGIAPGKAARLPAGAQAVAAMLPVGYTRTHLPAYRRRPEAPLLPLYGYTAAALYKDQVCVAALKTADNEKWHPYRYNTPDLRRKVARVKKDLPGNSIVEQLARCSLTWHCCTAQNLFYQRWEAGIPVSPTCNAHCLGCISLQPAECCPAPQSRITVAPNAAEIAAVACYHLDRAPEGIVSFGQGCEGEPSLAAKAVTVAIRDVRARTRRGQININTNAGYTDGIREIVDAGLDSMRVSMISARPDVHQAYYRGNYSLEQVRDSIRYARQKKVHVSINMLLFPGLNDRREEQEAWLEWIRETGVDMIQLRNLNYDPDEFVAAMPAGGSAGGVSAFLQQLQSAVPELVLGNFTQYLPQK